MRNPPAVSEGDDFRWCPLCAFRFACIISWITSRRKIFHSGTWAVTFATAVLESVNYRTLDI